MINRLRHILQFIYSNKLVFITIIVVTRALLLGFFISEHHENRPDMMVNSLVCKQYDYDYLLRAADNYFDGEGYHYLEGQVFMGRMPGYSAPYMLFRFIVGKDTAITLLILLQIAMSTWAIFVFSRLSFHFLKSKSLAVICTALLCLSGFLFVFDYHTWSESLSISTFILSCYYFFKYRENGKHSTLFKSGVFICWTIFLRPFIGILLPLIGLYFLANRTQAIKHRVFTALIFFSSFLVFESMWIIRNYKISGEFIPVQSDLRTSYGKDFCEGWINIRSLVWAWGGQATHNEKGGLGWYMRNATDEEVSQYKLPEHITMNVSYTKDSILHLRNLMRTYDTTTNIAEAESINALIASTAERYKSQFVSGNKFYFYVKSPVKAFQRLAIHSATMYFPLPGYKDCNVFEKFFKLFNTLLYYFILIIGTLATALTIRSNKQELRFLSRFNIAYIILILWVLIYYVDIQGPRYMISILPLLIIPAVYMVNQLYQILTNKFSGVTNV